jgi:hypothetical protein
MHGSSVAMHGFELPAVALISASATALTALVVEFIPVDPAQCDHCHHEIPPSWVRCPHCGLPGLFPNVRAAQAEPERKALERRYENARQVAADRGAEAAVQAFEEATRGSKAVIARSMRELDRLSVSDKELLPPYYGLLQGKARLPHGDEWDGLRGVADEALFPGYKEEIHFAALTLDGLGLRRFGDCSFGLRENMIAHRASVYEENSALAMRKHAYKPPLGYRASWAERAKLCVAKTAGEIEASTPEDRFPRLLLEQGATPPEDRFVEVHVWGPLSILSVERAVVGRIRSRSVRKSLRDRLAMVGASLEEVG